MLIFLVICKERFPVIECLLVSVVSCDKWTDMPLILEDRNLVYRGLGVFQNIPLRMILMRHVPPYLSA
jgi:hypothetical protein